MAIKFNCPKCKKELVVKDELAGKAGKCPGCQSVLKVPSATPAAAITPVKRKPVEEVIVEAADDDEVVAAVVDDDQDEAPRKKKKRRDDDDDDDDDDDRRPKAKKKSSRRDDDDDDDEDDDDRRSRKKRASAKRRDDDDDDDDDDDEPKKSSPKQRRKAFGRAALGMKLNFIGHLIYAGTAGAVAIFVIIQTIMLSAKGGFLTDGSFINILNWLTCIALLGAMIVIVVGSAFLIMTPCKGGAFGLAIATCATAGFVLILIIVRVANHADSKIIVDVSDPFVGIALAGSGGPRGFGGPSGGDVAMMIFLPLLELGRIVCLSLYMWAVGNAQRDKQTANSGFLMSILAPSVLAGSGLVFWLLQKIITVSSFSAAIWVAGIFGFLHCIVVGGTLLWFAFALAPARETLEEAS